jgi:hypothetical protein
VTSLIKLIMGAKGYNYRVRSMQTIQTYFEIPSIIKLKMSDLSDTDANLIDPVDDIKHDDEEENEDVGNDDDTDDDVQEQPGGTVVTDREVADNITALLEGQNLPDTNSGKVDYKGSSVKPEMRDVMTHVIDNMKDHFGVGNDPSITINTNEELVCLAYNEQYKSKNEEACDHYYSPLTFEYKVNKQLISCDILALDNVYLDLTPKVTKSGDTATNHGITWVNVYIPNGVTGSISEKLRNDVGYAMSNKAITVDTDQNLSSITAGMSDVDPPDFSTMTPESDEDGVITGNIVITSEGSIRDIASNPELQNIYRCTLFTTMSMTVAAAVGSTAPPAKTLSSITKFKFNIVAARVYGVSENFYPVKLGRKTQRKNWFK